MDESTVRVSDLCEDVETAASKLPNPDGYRKIQCPQGKAPDDADLCRFVVSLQSDEALLRQNVASVDTATLSDIRKMEREIQFCLAKCNK